MPSPRVCKNWYERLLRSPSNDITLLDALIMFSKYSNIILLLPLNVSELKWFNIDSISSITTKS